MSMWDDLMSSLNNAENPSAQVMVRSHQQNGHGGSHHPALAPSHLSLKLSPRSSSFPSNLSSTSPPYFYDNISPSTPNAPSFPIPSSSTTPFVPSEYPPHPAFLDFAHNTPLKQRMSLPHSSPNYPYPLPQVASSKSIKQEEHYYHFQDSDHLSPTSFQQARVFNWADMNGKDSTSHTSGNASPFPNIERLDQEAFSPDQLRSLLQAINDGSISLPTSPLMTPSTTSSTRPTPRSRHFTTGGLTAGTVSPLPTTSRKPQLASTSSSRSSEENKQVKPPPGPPEHKKRRYTLPDSLRAYQRSLEDDTLDGQVNQLASNRQNSVSVTSKGKPPLTIVKRQFPKIEDVESDVSDYGNEGGPSNTSSSVAGDQDSEMQVDKSSKRTSGPSVPRNRAQNAASHPSTSHPSVDTHSCKVGGVELAIVRQPESHHRARYQKEGSRGCIKDRTGSSCPSIQLKGYNGKNLLLHAYIGTETDPIRPHPLYRVCKVGGKHSTPCREKVLDDGITCLEMDMTREKDYTLNIDCLGILKLRNADFDPTVVDSEEMTKRRKRSPKVRLVMRCPDVQLADGSTKTLQVISSPISCTPSPGVPEIHFISHNSCPASGDMDVVVIGRNFVKDDSRLFIAEKNNAGLNHSDSGEGENVNTPSAWEQELNLLQEHFSPVHLVGTIPPYCDKEITEPVEVLVFVRNKGGKTSEGFPFRYTPVERGEEARQSRSPSTTKSRPSVSTAPSALLELVEPHSSEEPMNVAADGDALPAVTAVSQPVPIQPRPQSEQAVYSLQEPLIVTTPSSMTSQAVEGGQMQYCIQLPGIVQPIIITIPQSPLQEQSVVGQPTIGVQSVMPPPAYNTLPVSNQAAYNQQQLPLMGNPQDVQPYQTAQQYPPNKVELLDTVVASSSMMRPETSNVNPSAVGPRDEDLFDELLKEILGPDSDMSEMMALMQQEGYLAAAGGGTNPNRNVNPADALNSFLTMNISKQRQHNPDGSL
ncbi:hypothetical protein RvY_14848 [Ramazzottius varieornatus]|uniref:RHD domain-containing protein n=1 Tax=Ramazzottius varieornatus TaxID=947166 RepID=A0A1D1VZX3_RAMVA|nr:hypothetical protein RvY_14848 [Ramazzottius varieornatus]